MSLFDAFVGGVADAGAGLLDQQIKSSAEIDRQKALMQFQADLAENKMRTENALKEQFAQQRAQTVTGYLQQGAQDKAQQTTDKINQQYGTPEIGDTPLSDEQQQVLDTAMAQRQGIINKAADDYTSDPTNRVKAGNKLGYYSDDDVLKLDQRQQQLDNAGAMLDAREKRMKDKADYEAGLLEVKRQLADAASKGKDQVLGWATQSRTNATQDLNAALRAEEIAQSNVANKLKEKPERGGNKNYEQDLTNWTNEFNAAKEALAKRQQATVAAQQASAEIGKMISSALSGYGGNDLQKSSIPSSPSIPQGYTPIGQTKDGKTVYQGPDGKKYILG